MNSTCFNEFKLSFVAHKEQSLALSPNSIFVSPTMSVSLDLGSKCTEVSKLMLVILVPFSLSMALSNSRS